MLRAVLMIILFILFSAFFSGSETAFASANKLRLRRSAEDGGAADRLAADISENYDEALSAILFGNNLVNIAASSATTVLAMTLTGDETGVALATAIITVAIIIFGEIAPKIAASRISNAMCRAVAYPLKAVMVVTRPVVWLMDALLGLLGRLWGSDTDPGSVTEEELVTIIEMVEDEGVIDEEQSELLQSAIEFSDITAQEVITPRVDMVAIDIDDSFEDILDTVNSSPYSRIPVYQDTVDNIIGVLYLNRFYRQALDRDSFDIRDMLMDVLYIPKTLKLPNVLSQFRKKQQHLAVVTDEYGGTLGIITMEDVLEELVGEIWDETDTVEADIVHINDETYIASGDMSIYDFLEELGIDPDSFEGDYTTVGGWATEMLSTFPKKGDSFDYRGISVTVLEAEDRRVLKVRAVVGDTENEE
ncbi:MAG: HlyC/CorC family transporter [Eubacteriaceae bacterium]|nr:HlyC/CorC family transporter [Eubacteriaceae bacterium]